MGDAAGDAAGPAGAGEKLARALAAGDDAGFGPSRVDVAAVLLGLGSAADGDAAGDAAVRDEPATVLAAGDDDAVFGTSARPKDVSGVVAELPEPFKCPVAVAEADTASSGDAVDMRLEKCANCGELVSCIAKVWREDVATRHDSAPAGRAVDGGRSKADDVKRLLGELEDFRAAKRNKGEARPLSRSPALLEGAACPRRDMGGCKGVILATPRLSTDHVYLRCSNNDPKRLGTKRDQLCTWSFNSLREADPDFADAVLRRRDQENGPPK